MRVILCSNCNGKGTEMWDPKRGGGELEVDCHRCHGLTNHRELEFKDPVTGVLMVAKLKDVRMK